MAEVVVTGKGQKYQQEIKVGKHTFQSDILPESGGGDTAPGPHELMLGALGSCTAITVQMFAERRGWDLKSVTVKLTEDKIDDPSNPSVKIPKIVRNIEVSGNLTGEQLDSLKAIADKCQIHKLLTGNKEITTDLKHNQAVAS
jgi:putative redox protein